MTFLPLFMSFRISCNARSCARNVAERKPYVRMYLRARLGVGVCVRDCARARVCRGGAAAGDTQCLPDALCVRCRSAPSARAHARIVLTSTTDP